MLCIGNNFNSKMEIFFTVRENNEMKHHVTASSQQQHWSPALDPFE